MSEHDFLVFKKKALFERKFNFDNYSQEYVKRRVSVRMLSLGIAMEDWAAYNKRLETDPAEYDKLFDAFSVNVTEFFRDPPLWVFFRNGFLTRMAAEKAVAGKRSLRIWSAGCSTGEEPYSLAMIVKDSIPSNIAVSIVATDIDAGAIAKAQEGLYGDEALKNMGAVNPLYMTQYFTPVGKTVYGSIVYRISEAMRSMVQFKKHHFIDDEPFASVDMILCRNAMIYVGRETKKKVLSIFHRSLVSGGRLVLGKTEVVFASRGGNLFAIENLAEHVYKKIKDVSQGQGECNGQNSGSGRF
jgi:chemotaxis protein methyltransferase CheR